MERPLVACLCGRPWFWRCQIAGAPSYLLQGCVVGSVCLRCQVADQGVLLRRRYPGTEKNTLEDISLFCTLNSRVAVLGPNGAGKSTMIKVRPLMWGSALS